jgi:hypothetical protein
MLLSLPLTILRHLFITPPVYLLHYLVLVPSRLILYYASLPFRLLGSSLHSLLGLIIQLILSFEAILTFLAAAALIGVCAGCLLHLSSRIWITVFHISPADEVEKVEAKPAVRTIESYRQERKRKKREESGGLRPGALAALNEYQLSGKISERRGGSGRSLEPVRNQTILEEPSSGES